MFDLSDAIRAFHDNCVALSETELHAVRVRQNALQDHLASALQRTGQPIPVAFEQLGSYATETMIKSPVKRPSMDVGICFKADDLTHWWRRSMSSKEARDIVRAALTDHGYQNALSTLQNCERVTGEEDIDIDLSVYRRTVHVDDVFQEPYYHLASGDKWAASEAMDTVGWFADKIRRDPNRQQLLRVTRLIKRFALEHSNEQNEMLDGFTVGVLAVDHFVAVPSRDDLSFKNTLSRIQTILEHQIRIPHPLDYEERWMDFAEELPQLTDAANEQKAKNFLLALEIVDQL